MNGGRRPGISVNTETRSRIIAALNSGQSPSEIAEKYGVTSTTVYNWKKKLAQSADMGIAARISKLEEVISLQNAILQKVFHQHESA